LSNHFSSSVSLLEVHIRGDNIHESGEETGSVVAAVPSTGESRSDLLTEVRVGRGHSTNRDKQFCPATLTEQLLRLYEVHGTPELKCFYVPQPRTIITIQEKEVVSADAYLCERRWRTRDHEKTDGIE
jgi:hypothetical protein